MNAVEKLQAAIDKLAALKADSAPGVWSAMRDEATLGWYVESSEHGVLLSTGYVGNNDSQSHADLIVTLHRTIDAQLAILREAHDRPGWQDGELAYAPAAVALADAILGEE